jgi:hypothetical protein
MKLHDGDRVERIYGLEKRQPVVVSGTADERQVFDIERHFDTDSALRFQRRLSTALKNVQYSSYIR